jgi:serine/threonine protein kinase
VSDGATTIAAPPPRLPRAQGRPARPRPTWGLVEGDELAPGRTVLRALGGGRRCEALLVWDDHRLAVLVAKVLRPGHAADPVARAELAHEAALLGRLAHPVLVRGFDAALDGRFPHVVLEHLEGPTLRQLMTEHGPLALEQALPLGLHAASALHYLAAEGVVHLDVKPDNVVMGVPPRLIDLSVARTVAEAATVPRPIGTDAYMAPEQCAGGAPLGPAADVFGLAATLHHALADAPPFPRPAEARTAADPRIRFPQLVRAPAPLPRRTPPAIAELLRAALARDPWERPTAAEFALALEPAV